jgi:uncharacterized protein YceK
MNKNVITVTIYCIVFLTLVICSGCSSVRPHDNFVNQLNVMIGRNLDDIPSYKWPREKDLIGSVKLPNGNIKNRYKYKGTCLYIFEINPKSRQIVGASFEGNESDCIINP